MTYKVIAIPLMLLFTLLVAGCGNAHHGTYVNQQQPDDYLELRDDGTFFVMESNRGLSGNYELDGERLILISPTGASSVAQLRDDTIVNSEGLVWVKVDASAAPSEEASAESGTEPRNGMQGAFEKGTVLWYWYDGWVAVPFLLAALVLTIRLGQSIRKSELLALALMLIAILGTIPVIVVVFDRIGIWTTFSDPVTFGYSSMGGTGIAVLLGIAVPWWVARKSTDPEQVYAASDLPMGSDFTPEAPMPTLSGIDLGRTSVPTSSQASLSVRSGSQAGRNFCLEREVTTIGRSSDNSVVLEDPSVSRFHARITHEGPDYYLEDAGSSGGTFINGARVSQRERLASDSVIRLGDTEIAFLLPAPSALDATLVSAPAQSAGETMVLGQQKGTAWLLVQKGNQAGQSFVLRDGTTTIGRSPESTILLDDQEASLNHALITKVEDRYLVYDAGSSSGTRHNDQMLNGTPLEEGSTIVIGSSELEFSLVEGGAPLSPGATVILNRQERRGTLLVRSGPAAGQSFSLGQDLVIGREPGPTGAVINDAAISRRHLLVRSTPEGFFVHDLGSANGTSVDGTSLLGQSLDNGDVIQLGATVLQFGKS